MVAVELVIDVRAERAEGPVWHPEERVLYWVDVYRGDVHRFDPEVGSDTVLHVGQAVGALAPRRAGGLLLALRDGFATLDTVTGGVVLIAPVEQDRPENRMTDGHCDTGGRFWAGTLSSPPREGSGTLYRLEGVGGAYRVTPMVEGVTTSNGIAWSLDDRRMYYIDASTRGIDVFDFDGETGSIARRRRLITIPADQGKPDGMAIDAEGYVWVALFGGSAVRRYAPDGRLDRTIDIAASQVTALAFGGDDLSDLYITTATENMSANQLADEPSAGAVFRCRPGVRGTPAPFFHW